MKKILQIIPSFNNSWGGPKNMVENLSEYIITNNLAEVDIACTDVFGEFSKPKNKNIKIIQSKTSFLNKIWIGHSNEFRKFINVKISDYDIIHIHEMWHFLHFYSIKLARKHKIPYIITPHGGLEKEG